MSMTATKKLTFEEFVRLDLDDRYELVDGRLEKLMAPMPKHGWSSMRIASRLDHYLDANDADGYWGCEVDIPTLPFHGRRPDFVYYSPEDAAESVDLVNNRVFGVPTLAVEVTSPGDEARDEIVKRDEYARVGIRHFWILDPARRVAITCRLADGEYVIEARFSGSTALESPLFPGLSIPLKKLFR